MTILSLTRSLSILFASLGIAVFAYPSATLSQEKAEEEKAVIILELRTEEMSEADDDKDEADEKEEKKNKKSEKSTANADKKQLKEADEDADEDKDEKVKSKEAKKQKKKTKEAKPEPKEERSEAREERRPRQAREVEPRRSEDHRPESPRREGWPTAEREDRGRQMDERRQAELHRQMEHQQAQMDRRREELERSANEMRAQIDQMRREAEIRQQRQAVAPEALQQAERKNHALAERLEVTQHQLEERNREIEKLRVLLAEREKAVISLKEALAKHAGAIKTEPKEIDKALAARVERLEVEIKRLLAIAKEKASQAAPQPKVKAVAPKLEKKPVAQSEQEGTLLLDTLKKPPQADKPTVAALLKLKQANSSPPIAPQPLEEAPRVLPEPKLVDAPPPTPKFEESVVSPPKAPLAPSAEKPLTPSPNEKSVIPAPKPMLPLTESPQAKPALGGVGVVEGDVTAILPQEGKIVLKVSTWNDGKQLRADWVGQQVSISQDGMPSVKIGDHISLDARIDSQKGFVWGGNVFQAK